MMSPLASSRGRSTARTPNRQCHGRRPRYLFASGIALFILGAIISALKPGGPPLIDPRMRDRDIVRQLEGSQGGSTVGSLLVIAGLSCIGLSIVWRLARAAIAFTT